ncbi:MAG: hypothetical protein JW850_20195 [Thermoflexales bacterium]|nr:hypothetical protein [Thermoflexales bacterium]
MPDSPFDASGRFVIPGYAAARPFASFLPGIAGPNGIPMWVLYVNRGQAVASFGIQDKDSPVIEFQPANKAYMQTPYTGFRTFIKLARGGQHCFYEPFSPWQRPASARQHMAIGMNELELQETDPGRGLQVNVLYFTLPGEDIAALVRSVRLKNIAQEPLELELLDGLPAVIPYGVTNEQLKAIGRTIEAWMEVVNWESHVPFYRLPTRAADVAQVEAVQAGHFALSFTTCQGQSQLLPVLVDPTVVFGPNTALSAPDNFLARPLAELLASRQIAVGRTPCGFFAASASLAPSEEIALVTVVGHSGSLQHLARRYERLLSPAYIDAKRREGNELIRQLTDVVVTHTSSPTFDAYCRQTFLDNVMRGGWPLLLGDAKHPLVYHVYSRKHGDLERDYNNFFLAAEYYSQGNGNYRDVNQNRRCDVLLNPGVGDYNVRAFVSLLQADGYNPLVVLGSQLTLPAEARAAVLAQVAQPEHLEPALSHPFTPGSLLKYIDDRQLALRVSRDEFLRLALKDAEQHFEAEFGEGYWIDHWTYIMDMVETFLAVYPERQDELLFGDPSLPFFDSPAVVRRRSHKYVLAGGRGRQVDAVVEDEEKATLIARRSELPKLVRVENGLGAVYRTSLFAKLLSLALLKFATMDPAGMGIEMEANKPGWCDAMNGLPSLFGSSLPESYELVRLLAFLRSAIQDKVNYRLDWPVELCRLLRRVVEQVKAYNHSAAPERDWVYWDAVASAREDYRDSIRLGFGGETQPLDRAELAEFLGLALAKVQAGLERAAGLSDGVPPTYFSYQVEDYEPVLAADGTPRHDAQGRPHIRPLRFKPAALPLYLEGPARALKVQTDQAAARRLYEQVKASPLFDRKLGMYRLNASLAGQPHDIGRARAFTPGWLENESIWLHMEYKYMLAVLQAGLYDEFFQDFKTALIPFQDPAVYGRSPLENSSFLVSSAHPDESLHGAGFVARLSGSTAEFLSMWTTMMAGPKPFRVQDGQLCLALKPALPAWLFDAEGTIAFRFLGSCTVSYHNPDRLDTFRKGVRLGKLTLHTRAGQTVEYAGGLIRAPHAAMVRQGEVDTIHVSVECGTLGSWT